MPSQEADYNRLRQSIADACQLVADLSGDARFKTAAGVLTGRPAGRPSIDDAEALEAVRCLIATGIARSVHEACHLAAEARSDQHSVEAAARRLRKKFGRN